MSITRADDAALYAAPISHGAGLYNFIDVRLGGRHVMPESGGFDPDEVLFLWRSWTMSRCSPRRPWCAGWSMPREAGEKGEGIRTIVYGGGPMYLADIRDAIATMGQRFVQIYGQGESPMTITALSRECMRRATPGYQACLASVGMAQACVECASPAAMASRFRRARLARSRSAARP